MTAKERVFGVGLTALFAIVVAGVFMAGGIGTTSATGGGPEMRLVITGGDCDGAECNVALGEAFTMGVEVVAGTEGGYIGAQSFMKIGSDLVYNITEDAEDELVWPDCEAAVLVRDNSPPSEINHGCLTGLIGPDPVEYTGVLWELSFNCSAEPSSTLVELVPLGEPPAGTSGAGFQFENGDQVAAKVSDVTINCGEGGEPTTPPAETPTDTPTAETPTADTPTDTPTTEPPTPTPTTSDQPCGDVDGDGDVDSVDALWDLWVTAGLVQESELEKDGDINGDGDITSIDAALILQISAGLYSC